MKNTAIVFTVLTAYFAMMHMPLASVICALVVLGNTIRIEMLPKFIWLHAQRSFFKACVWLLKKPMKKVPEKFTVTGLELDAYYSRLRKEKAYKGMNDAAILQKREAEMLALLTKAVEYQYNNKSKMEDHFSLQAQISFDDSNKIILRIKPKSEFGNDFCKGVMNSMIDKNDGKEYFLYDED